MPTADRAPFLKFFRHARAIRARRIKTSPATAVVALGRSGKLLVGASSSTVGIGGWPPPASRISCALLTAGKRARPLGVSRQRRRSVAQPIRSAGGDGGQPVCRMIGVSAAAPWVASAEQPGPGNRPCKATSHRQSREKTAQNQKYVQRAEALRQVREPRSLHRKELHARGARRAGALA